jgi:nucleoside 2-deoxyribosyltransferase
LNVYVASSWRNPIFDSVVVAIREAGHTVYNFKEPIPGKNGFHWSEIDPNWKDWSLDQIRVALGHQIALDGFEADINALWDCDACVLVMPCGRSAHLEMGWACGAGKKTILLMGEGEPELMVNMVDYLCVDIEEVLEALALP